MSYNATRLGLLVTFALGVVLLLSIAGCGGGGDAVGPGGVRGWVHISDNQSSIIITGSRISPDGYSPLGGAEVWIDGFPELNCLTDVNGYYDIYGIPVGRRTIVVSWGGREIRFAVPVYSCRYTIGGGHSQGGGGFF